MNRSFIILTGLLLVNLSLFSNYYSYLPYTITQPDGDTISCFVSGDEYFNWIHDQEGYTIIQAPDGYFYYGEVSDNSVIPSKYIVNSVNPVDVGLKKWAKISLSEYQKVKDSFNSYKQGDKQGIKEAPHTGALNNLVVYIRFSDDTEFTTNRQTFDNKFNIDPGTSLKSYFTEVSYSQLNVNSTHYPECEMTTNLSYQDSHPRSYFQPYNATTNPDGYSGGDNGGERTQREHTLLRDAINWINSNSPVPEALNIDGDNDGLVDNVCFNIVGGNGGWAQLLWAHSWSLYSYTVNINGKRVYKYTFQPETQINVQTLCHEMFHSIGAPDLYHYTGNGINPVGSWDLMESGFGHMGAYMKWKYTNHAWISDIPEITASGTYTLNPLGSSSNNCYKIASPNSTSQFFIVEYRRKVAGTYENNVPGSGLLVYRINTNAYGNSSGPPDEVYIFRPDGTTTINGTLSNAYFSSESGRTSINDFTNPTGFLQDGSLGGLNISDITSAGNTISFTVGYTIVLNPANFTTTASSHSQIDLGWLRNANNDSILLLYNTTPTFGRPENGTEYLVGNTIPGGGTVICSGSDTTFNHNSLQAETTYYYKLFSVSSDTVYSSGITQSATTPCGVITSFPWNVDFERSETLPRCWSQEIDNIQGYGWMVRNGNGENNPSTAHSGIFNGCLRTYSPGENKARLITPTLDLSTIDNPTLSFWHTQELSETNQDILTVYYKTSEVGSWIQLVTFTSNIANWTHETISLPNITSTYSICFEGNAKNGYGICLDDVEINESTIPANFNLINDTIGDGLSACYNAFDTIIVAGFDTYVEFLNGSTVNLIAGKSIFLLSGFHAYEGNYTHACITTEALFCDSLTESSVMAQNNKKSVTVPEIQLKNDKTEKLVKVYPNPNNGRFTIELTNFEGISSVSIINTLGTVVSKTSILNNDHTELDLIHFQKGLYFVNIKNGETIKTGKIIIH